MRLHNVSCTEYPLNLKICQFSYQDVQRNAYVVIYKDEITTEAV